MSCTIGSVLLSSDYYYLGSDGQLPGRVGEDKANLKRLIKDQRVLCSMNTLMDLPNSLRTAAESFTTNINDSYDINFGISTFSKAPPDIMIITVSPESLGGGKHFDMRRIEQQYNLIFMYKEIQIWQKF